MADFSRPVELSDYNALSSAIVSFLTLSKGILGVTLTREERIERIAEINGQDNIDLYIYKSTMFHEVAENLFY